MNVFKFQNNYMDYRKLPKTTLSKYKILKGRYFKFINDILFISIAVIYIIRILQEVSCFITTNYLR